MKDLGKIIPIVMVVVMCLSWYMLISDRVGVSNEYEKYLEDARGFAQKGITKYAIENYGMALQINDDPDIYVEVSDYYKSQEKHDERLNWNETFLELHPTEPKAYDALLDSYYFEEDYEACFDVLIVANKRGISTDYIKELSAKLEYVYRLDRHRFDDVKSYSNNFCAVSQDGLWGFVDRYGTDRIGCKYVQVGAYTQTNMVSVVNSDAMPYFIDKTGAKVLVSDGNYKSFGLLIDNIIAAVRNDGKYTYIDPDCKVLFGEYDYASSINGGVGAVQVNGKWQIINAEGKPLSKMSYLDIKLDEKQIACRLDRLFVSLKEGQYIMVDSKGKQIGDLVFEDAYVFLEDAPTAVKINGKWCFVGVDGKLVSDKKYDEARPFSNGLAAVCVKGLWGFVDSKEKVAITPAFQSAKDFTAKGSCFVKLNDEWQLLKLYRLNREDV